jgi:outer membrane protein assembly factor BamA
VSGEPDTKKAFPKLFEDAEHDDLGWVSAGIAWDTRDSQRNPYRGFVARVRSEFAAVQRGGDLGARHRFDFRPVFPVPALFHDGGDAEEENPPTDTLAFSGLVELTSGDLPFFALPTLGGGETQRGYITGRFRDKALWQAAAEWRFWVVPRGIGITRSIRIERLGLAPFYEVGSVADDGVSLFDAKLRHSYGIGLRLTLERAAPFRVDIGFSDERVEVTATFGLPF